MLRSNKLLYLDNRSKLIQVIRIAFSSKSQRDRVPNIMKDPKFTRSGISKKKPTSYQYDLSQSHIKYPERFYDAKEDRKQSRLAYKQRKVLKRGLEIISKEDIRPLENIIKDLTDDQILHEGSSRIINNIHEIEKNYSGKLSDTTIRDVIIESIQALTKRLHQKNFRELGIISTLNKKYAITDKETWQVIINNFIRFFKREENESFEIFGSEINEENFVHTFNNIVQISRYNGIDLSLLMDLIEKNYLEKVNSFKNTNSLALFVASISNHPNMKNKSEFWTAIEKEISSKIDTLNSEDIVSVIYSFSKVKYSSDLVDKLVNKFLQDFSKLNQGKVEKICIVAQSLANLKKRLEKFNLLAEKEIEKEITNLKSVSEARLIASSFPRLGIRSKTIMNHIDKLIVENANNLSLNQIESLMISGINSREFSKGYYNSIATCFEKFIDSNKNLIDSSKAKLLKGVLEKWETNGLYKNSQLLEKLQNLQMFVQNIMT